jgi:hypothetical protein
MFETTMATEFDTPLYTPSLEGDEFVPAMNALLRGELAAVESYDQALEKYPEGRAIAQLRQIRIDHYAAVRDIRNCIRSHGGLPTETSGAWGVFAAAVTGTAKTISLDAVLSALRQGEELGLSDYESFIANMDNAADCRRLVADRLLPKSRQHVAMLKDIPEAS